jgi:hypothetical protein
MCTKRPAKPSGVAAVEVEDDECLSVLTVAANSDQVLRVEVVINGQVVKMLWDTGSVETLVGLKVFESLRTEETRLIPVKKVLRSYTSDPIPILGEAEVNVKFNGEERNLKLLVVDGEGLTLFGWKWMYAFALLPKICMVLPSLESVLEQYADVFDGSLGKVKNLKVKLTLKPGAQPKLLRPRPMPFAIREIVENDLKRLEEQGTITKVSTSTWASPIVPVKKADGTIRICGDYKIAVNQSLQVDQYPIPSAQALYAKLLAIDKFTVIDLSNAYNQLELDDDSKALTTITTHKGLYQYNRMPFGIASAPALFQDTIERVLQGMANVICRMDDILITGSDDVDHINNVQEVLRRLHTIGLKANKKKSRFMQAEILYLGHLINKNGIKVCEDKIRPVLECPRPANVAQLRSWLGMINYYSNFIPNLSTLETPLTELLKKNHEWRWHKEQENSWEQMKNALASTSILVHYSGKKELRLECDASPYGVGAVISHVMEDGTARPVAYASRSLSSAEKNYPQIEREALAIVFGVKRFHQYLYGRAFTLVTDCKPLTTIFGPKTAIPTLAALRMQRWALQLMAYDYTIEFRPTAQHGNVDGLSRLPLEENDGPDCHEETEVNWMQLSSLPILAKDICRETRRDAVLAKVLDYSRQGWPSRQHLSCELHPFDDRKTELSIEQDCLMWGCRVIIPEKLKERMLEELHSTHIGMSRMKALARQHVWWPKMDADIEETVRRCAPCQEIQQSCQPVPLHPMVWPDKAWQRVHIDYAGPFQGKMFLICVDAYSKWPEVIRTEDTTTVGTILKLAEIFSRFGLPEQLVSDNGPQFTSEEFKKFTTSNGIKHILSSPYHPRSNGAAERMVRTFKQAMKASLGESTDVNPAACLSQFLLKYRSTPHATTQMSPAELLLGRRVRTKLDLAHPDTRRIVNNKLADQERHHNRGAVDRDFREGEAVWCETFRSGKKWQKGKIVERRGPSSYLVDVGEGMQWRRHADHIRRAFGNPPEEPTKEETNQKMEAAPPAAEIRRSQRERRPPKRFSLEECSIVSK